MLHPYKAEAVKRVPLLASVTADNRVWWPSEDGIYNVKYAYHLFLNKIVDSSHLQKEGKWNMIWNLSIPHKKFFFGKLAGIGNCLPMRTRLQRKGLICSDVCITCLENCWHCFLTCPLSQDCWKQANLWEFMEPLLVQVGTFSDFVFRLGSMLNWQRRDLFVMIFWSIWRRRNLKLWEDESEDVSQVLTRASHVLEEWIFARKISDVRHKNSFYLHCLGKASHGLVEMQC